MNRLLANLTLSTKILLATGGTLVLVVAIAWVLVVADHYQDANARLLAEAITQADLIASNAAPSLSAHDRVEAERMLGSLQAAPTVLAARVLDDHGVPLADYQTSRARRQALKLEAPASAGSRLDQDHLEVYRPVVFRGKPIGMLAIATDLTSFRYDFVGFGIRAILIALIALVIAYLLTAAAHRAILEPIGSLTAIVRRAFAEKRDDLRANVKPGDESGVLAEAFNALLERIVERESSLRRELAERNQAQRRLDELAHYDPVTKLPNRHFFLRQLERVLLEAAKTGSAGALLLIDLNKLKHVNDTLGHDAGDSLLRQFAKRLSTSLRDSDVLCRLGGDQFALILSEISGESHLVTVANKLLAIVRQPVTLGEREVTVSSSIGIAVFPVDGNEPQIVLRHAETALHRAKAAGKNNHLFFSPDMLDRDSKWINVRGELQRALENGELRLHFQPQVSLDDGKLRGLEALLRWQHPEHGLLLPGEFMQLAEDNARYHGRDRRLDAGSGLRTDRRMAGRIDTAGADRAELFCGAVARQACGQAAARAAHALRSSARVPRDRDRREPAHVRAGRRRSARSAAQARLARDGGPLRRRLLEPDPAQGPARHRAQDRPRVRARHRRVGEVRRYHASHRLARRPTSVWTPSPKAWRARARSSFCAPWAAAPIKASAFARRPG